MSGRNSAASGLTPAQMTFSFVLPEDRQAMSEIYEQHVLKADARASRSAKIARKRATLKVVGNRALNIDWARHRHLLDLPLMEHSASDLDVQPDETEWFDASEDEATPDMFGRAPSKELDHSVIVEYHEQLLNYSLNLLKSRGNAEEKFEILQWIWSPDIFCWKQRQENGKSIYDPVPRNGLPFTFQTCCSLTGMDYDRLRDGLARVLRPTLIAVGLGHLVKNETEKTHEPKYL